MNTHTRSSSEQALQAIIPVRPATGPDRAPSSGTPDDLSRRTLGFRFNSRRTFGSRFNSRRTLGWRFPSRRTLGLRFPSRRALG